MSSASSVPAKSSVSTFVPLATLRASPTNPRKYFDPKKLKELSESVKEHTILEPLLVRDKPDGSPAPTEIVCGERRYRAAKMAGLSEVPVVFRDFTDEEVEIVQLVENGQREDLSPLEEAETYAALAAKGMTPRAIAKQVNREASVIAKRIPLAGLTKRVKDALASGAIGVEYAELIARIPDAKLHDEALKRIVTTQFYGSGGDAKEGAVVRALPYPVAKRLIEEEFMSALSLAVFDPEDPALSPLGACSKCPHLAGNNPDLFGDVKKAVCTNPKDFRLKTENHLKRLRETGYIVLLTPKDLKRAYPYADSDQLGKDFVDLESICPDDPKRRRYEELLGRDVKLKITYVLKNGRVRKLCPTKDLKATLVAHGHAFGKEKQKRKAAKEASRSHAQLERIGEEAVSRDLAMKLRKVKLTPSGWLDLIVRAQVLAEGWRLEGVLRRHGYDGSREEFAHNRERIVKDRIAAMTDIEKRAFLVDLLVGGWITTADKAERELYKEVLKLAGVDYARVANAAIDAAKEKAAEAKKTPKPPIAAKKVRISRWVKKGRR
ncbi:MAG TPA: ParB/RepB/Spo0J family partition protein [Thermoanaerobaculia bacterium]|jgi:ParB/RepB/Spo0J family partition protein